MPSNASFKAYVDFWAEKYRKYHRLDCHGPNLFDFDELSVFIKALYQFQTGRECDILKFGSAIEISYLTNVFPIFYYLIGTKYALEKYAEYNGKYYEELDKFSFNNPQDGMVIIPEATTNRTFDPKNIDLDVLKTFKYYEYKYAGKNAIAIYRKYESIFKPYRKSETSKINTHRDALVPMISAKENFISDILYSVMIYKNNNGKTTLTDEDYNTIFNTLYHENVPSFSNQVEAEKPKILTYVKDQKSRDRFKDYRWKPSR